MVSEAFGVWGSLGGLPEQFSVQFDNNNITNNNNNRGGFGVHYAMTRNYDKEPPK